MLRIMLKAGLVVLATASAASAQTPHAVGFRAIDTVDLTRSFPAASGRMGPRPMRLYVWYPAAGGQTGRAVTLEDLLREGPIDPRTTIRMLYGNPADTTRADSLLRVNTTATWNVPPQSGPFPVVLLAPAPPAAIAATAELLASHGHVVIGSEPRDHMTRQSLEFTPNAANTEAAVEDLEFMLAVARGWSIVDADRVGTLAMSSSGIATIAFALRTRVPAAVAVIEGWEGRERGAALLREYRHFDPASFRSAYLLLESTNEWPGFTRTDGWLDAIGSAPRWRVAVDSAGHGDFLWLETLLPRATTITHRTFRIAQQYLLAFFRDRLSTTPAATWLPPTTPPEVRVRAFDVAAPRPGREEFFHLAETEPARALAIARTLATPPFTESSLTRLANLTQAARPADAAILYEIVAAGYPGSARAAIRWSDALAGLGRTAEARVAAIQALAALAHDPAIASEQRETLRARMQARIDGS